MQTDIFEFLRTTASVAAFAMSLLSLWFTRRLWVESNRPIVTAEVRTHSGGNVAILYNLAVINSGSRPAVNIRLIAENRDVEGALELNVHTDPRSAPFLREISRCFSSEVVIPLLLNGRTVTNAFGVTGGEDGGSFWRSKASIPVRVTYSDLEGRRFTSRVVLVIKDSMGFAGSYWGGKAEGEPFS